MHTTVFWRLRQGSGSPLGGPITGKPNGKDGGPSSAEDTQPGCRAIFMVGQGPTYEDQGVMERISSGILSVAPELSCIVVTAPIKLVPSARVFDEIVRQASTLKLNVTNQNFHFSWVWLQRDSPVFLSHAQGEAVSTLLDALHRLFQKGKKRAKKATTMEVVEQGQPDSHVTLGVLVDLLRRGSVVWSHGSLNQQPSVVKVQLGDDLPPHPAWITKQKDGSQWIRVEVMHVDIAEVSGHYAYLQYRNDLATFRSLGGYQLQQWTEETINLWVTTATLREKLRMSPLLLRVGFDADAIQRMLSNFINQRFTFIVESCVAAIPAPASAYQGILHCLLAVEMHRWCLPKSFVESILGDAGCWVETIPPGGRAFEKMLLDQAATFKSGVGYKAKKMWMDRLRAVVSAKVQQLYCRPLMDLIKREVSQFRILQGTTEEMPPTSRSTTCYSLDQSMTKFESCNIRSDPPLVHASHTSTDFVTPAPPPGVSEVPAPEHSCSQATPVARTELEPNKGEVKHAKTKKLEDAVAVLARRSQAMSSLLPGITVSPSWSAKQWATVLLSTVAWTTVSSMLQLAPIDRAAISQLVKCMAKVECLHSDRAHCKGPNGYLGFWGALLWLELVRALPEGLRCAGWAEAALHLEHWLQHGNERPRESDIRRDTKRVRAWLDKELGRLQFQSLIPCCGDILLEVPWSTRYISTLTDQPGPAKFPLSVYLPVTGDKSKAAMADGCARPLMDATRSLEVLEVAKARSIKAWGVSAADIKSEQSHPVDADGKAVPMDIGPVSEILPCRDPWLVQEAPGHVQGVKQEEELGPLVTKEEPRRARSAPRTCSLTEICTALGCPEGGSITPSQNWMQLKCDQGCDLWLHSPQCWREVDKMLRKDRPGYHGLPKGQVFPCVVGGCHGFLLSVEQGKGRKKPHNTHIMYRAPERLMADATFEEEEQPYVDKAGEEGTEVVENVDAGKAGIDSAIGKGSEPADGVAPRIVTEGDIGGLAGGGPDKVHASGIRVIRVKNVCQDVLPGLPHKHPSMCTVDEAPAGDIHCHQSRETEERTLVPIVRDDFLDLPFAAKRVEKEKTKKAWEGQRRVDLLGVASAKPVHDGGPEEGGPSVRRPPKVPSLPLASQDPQVVLTGIKDLKVWPAAKQKALMTPNPTNDHMRVKFTQQRRQDEACWRAFAKQLSKQPSILQSEQPCAAVQSPSDLTSSSIPPAPIKQSQKNPPASSRQQRPRATRQSPRGGPAVSTPRPSSKQVEGQPSKTFSCLQPCALERSPKAFKTPISPRPACNQTKKLPQPFSCLQSAQPITASSGLQAPSQSVSLYKPPQCPLLPHPQGACSSGGGVKHGQDTNIGLAKGGDVSSVLDTVVLACRERWDPVILSDLVEAAKQEVMCCQGSADGGRDLRKLLEALSALALKPAEKELQDEVLSGDTRHPG